MARYRVLSWRDIPSLVEASDGHEVVQRPLTARFQELIDTVAMREGAADSDVYLEGWAHGPETEREGTAAAVAAAVVAELEAGFAELATRRVKPSS